MTVEDVDAKHVLLRQSESGERKKWKERGEHDDVWCRMNECKMLVMKKEVIIYSKLGGGISALFTL